MIEVNIQAFLNNQANVRGFNIKRNLSEVWYGRKNGHVQLPSYTGKQELTGHELIWYWVFPKLMVPPNHEF